MHSLYINPIVYRVGQIQHAKTYKYIDGLTFPAKLPLNLSLEGYPDAMNYELIINLPS